MNDDDRSRRDLETMNKNIDFNLVIIIVLLAISIIVQIVDLVHRW